MFVVANYFHLGIQDNEHRIYQART